MLTACPVPEKAKSRNLVAAFIRGAPRDAEGFVFYGVKASNAAQWKAAWKAGGPVFVIDNSYFDATRGVRYRVTKNRLQVDPSQYETDGKRFAALGLDIQPWRWRDAGYWLVVHQSDDHSFSAPGHKQWLADAVSALPLGHRVVHRPWSMDKPLLASTLQEALAGARGLVAHTSAAAVQACLAGVQCIVSEQHALHGMTCGYGASAHLDQRRHFFGVLADHEFTVNELEDGTAWRRLNP